MKQKKSEGDIIKIKFDQQYHTYARVLTKVACAFYDCRTEENLEDLNHIISKPILFICTVSSNPVLDGKWPVIGNIPLEVKLQKNPLMFKEAIVPNGSPKSYIIDDNGIKRSATREECKGLEYSFIWSQDRIEERLRDYYAGRPNMQAEFYRIKD